MRLLLVEDDYLQRQFLEDHLARVGGSVMPFATESDLMGALPTLDPGRVDRAVVDVMVRWSNPSRAPVLPPPEVAKQGYHRAGCRIARALRHRMPRLPILLYSVLDESEVEGWRDIPDVWFLQKSDRTQQLTDWLDGPRPPGKRRPL